MRLIHTYSLEIKEFFGNDIPPYAILSHRWTEDETDLKEFRKGRRKDSSSYRKIVEFCNLAKSQSGVQWAWADTVCIDKRSSAELSEAINSMFQWYKAAQVCFVYLSDVCGQTLFEVTGQFDPSTGTSTKALSPHVLRSSWFTRGWTLQELLAPKRVLFFSSSWTFIGSKSNRSSSLKDQDMCNIHELSQNISLVTSIPTEVLTGEQPLEDVSVAEKMSWLSGRSTTRVEDMAYCAMGIFGIHMPLLYGEGENAFQRLQEEIIRTSNDESIFAWYYDPNSPRQRPILASGVADFRLCGKIKTKTLYRRLHYSVTNHGLQLRLGKDSAAIVTQGQDAETIVVPLNCSCPGYPVPYHEFNCIMLERQPCGHYDRIRASSRELLHPLELRQAGREVVLLEEDRTLYIHTASVQQACVRATGRPSQPRTTNTRTDDVEGSEARRTTPHGPESPILEGRSSPLPTRPSSVTLLAQRTSLQQGPTNVFNMDSFVTADPWELYEPVGEYASAFQGEINNIPEAKPLVNLDGDGFSIVDEEAYSALLSCWTIPSCNANSLSSEDSELFTADAMEIDSAATE